MAPANEAGQLSWLLGKYLAASPRFPDHEPAAG
jgi:hypothetical protein